jgi:hypothetical protein
MSLIEFDEKLFDTSFDKFLEFCTKVITYNSTGLKVNPLLVRLNKFKKVSDLMNSNDRKILILETLYKSNRDKILQFDNTWLTDRDVSISIGDNKDRCIKCSTIYKKTLKLKEEKEKSLEGLPDEAFEQAEEINFPDIFLLYTYRMFKAVVSDESENSKISTNLNSIQSDLGIEDSNSPNIKNNNSNPMPNNPLGDILNNLGPMIGNLTKGLGNMNMKGNNGMPNINGILNSLTGMMGNNPQLSKVVGETFGDLGECKTPQDMIGKLVGKINNPELQNAISTGIGSIAGNLNMNPEPSGALGESGPSGSVETLQITDGSNSISNPNTQS